MLNALTYPGLPPGLALGRYVPPPPELYFKDLGGVTYRFYLHSFMDPLPMRDVVYAFVNADNLVGYIGRAENLQDRQRGHEHRNEALRQGFGRLYVHWQALGDPIDYKSAETNLIRAYCPALNTQHNALAVWL